MVCAGHLQSLGDEPSACDLVCGHGDQWDHTAIDVDSRFVVSLVVGKRNGDNLEEVVGDFAERTGNVSPL